MPIETVLLAWLDSTEQLVMLVEAGFLLSILLFFMSGSRMVKQKVLERRLARYLPENGGDAQAAQAQAVQSQVTQSQCSTSVATGEPSAATCSTGSSADLRAPACNATDEARPSAATTCSAAQPALPLGLQDDDTLQTSVPSSSR